MTHYNKLQMACTASRLVSYESEYLHPFSHTRIFAWIFVTYQMKTCTDLGGLDPKNSGSKEYIILIDGCRPRYLHEIYRYATIIVGMKTDFTAIAISMNNKGRTLGDSCTSLDIRRKLSNVWFNSNGGKEYATKNKSLGTEIHKQK